MIMIRTLSNVVGRVEKSHMKRPESSRALIRGEVHGD